MNNKSDYSCIVIMTFGLVYSSFKFEKKKGTEADSPISYALLIIQHQRYV